MDAIKELWHYIELFFGAMFALFAWFVKDAINTIKEKIAHVTTVAKENQDHINKIKLDYVLKEDFRDFREELFNRLDRLEDIMRKGR